jgi:hypothetical protein
VVEPSFIDDAFGTKMRGDHASDDALAVAAKLAHCDVLRFAPLRMASAAAGAQPASGKRALPSAGRAADEPRRRVAGRP